MGSHSVTCQQKQVNMPRLNPTQAGWYSFTYPRGMEGWVDPIELFVSLCVCDSDPDDPDFSRQLRRPVEVKEDVRRMEERQRVKRILQSRAFRDELEELVIELQAGGGLSSALTVQRPLPTATGSHQPQTSSLIGHGKSIIQSVKTHLFDFWALIT